MIPKKVQDKIKKSSEDIAAETILNSGHKITFDVQKTLNNYGYVSQVSPKFIDSEDGIQREIDIISSKYSKITDDYSLIHRLIIENKYIPEDKPWIFFLQKEDAPYDFAVDFCKVAHIFPKDINHDIRISGPMARKWINYHPYYRVENMAILTEQAKSDRHESLYEAITSTAKTFFYEKDKSISPSLNDLLIYYPIIITKGPMFSIDWDQKMDSLEGIKQGLKPVKSLIARFTYPQKIHFKTDSEIYAQSFMYVHIIAFSEFEETLRMMNVVINDDLNNIRTLVQQDEAKK